MPEEEKKRKEGVYYPEQVALDMFGKCCDKCHDVYFEKTWPAHTAYYACLKLNCECHKSSNEQS